MSSPVTPNRPTNNTTCPGAPRNKQRPANLDLSGLAPRRLFSGECSPCRILDEEEMKRERNAFADPIAYVVAREALKV